MCLNSFAVCAFVNMLYLRHVVGDCTLLCMQFAGQTVLIGVDDMDLFKGIELKLMAVERVLQHHPEWRGKLVLIQVTNAPR